MGGVKEAHRRRAFRAGQRPRAHLMRPAGVLDAETSCGGAQCEKDREEA